MQYCCILANVFLIFFTIASVSNTISGCPSFLATVKMATLIPGYKGHSKCRTPTYPGTNDKVKRFPVPDEKCDWKIPFSDYIPTNYTAPGILKNPPWADKDAFDKSFQPRWNELDGIVDRRSHVQKYDVVDGVPRNPVGRTGINGRGLLGRWGPNHAADPIVTRWKRKNGNIIQDCNSGKPILQFVTIQRKDCKEWAIPGGMVDAGENVSLTLKREFGEEAMNSLQASPAQKIEIEAALKEFFSRGKEVYRGYVDDPRNTDNSWMETVAVNFHDDNGSSVGKFDLTAGDDAGAVKWLDISQSLELYASHRDFIHQVTELHGANW